MRIYHVDKFYGQDDRITYRPSPYGLYGTLRSYWGFDFKHMRWYLDWKPWYYRFTGAVWWFHRAHFSKKKADRQAKKLTEKEHMDIHIRGLRFVKTCDACPEQYDVFDKENNLVGYVRLRNGRLSCKYPDVFGDTIYFNYVGDNFTGEFENRRQRKHYLSIIADFILRRLVLD